ncbi:MAG TPA: hypothetical protein PK440_09700 [Candidatus Accumulibacter phosphatis]|nr:MAG: hypothetical protein AW07_00643 [Candidatus Accumulibacter sp. SK-11]HRQ95255.1 hypothetical protein [Candidatus Accumulibacter phosphatis]
MFEIALFELAQRVLCRHAVASTDGRQELAICQLEEPHRRLVGILEKTGLDALRQVLFEPELVALLAILAQQAHLGDENLTLTRTLRARELQDTAGTIR